MKVTEEDLICDLEGFPIEIAQAMVNEQVRQGNEANIKLFRHSITFGLYNGGFTWHKSKEGFDFWEDILRYKQFELFFARYPKQTLIKNVQTPSGVNYLILNPQ